MGAGDNKPGGDNKPNVPGAWHSTPPARPKNSPYRHILFYGEDFFDATNNHQFSVLSGDQPPTVVGGYAQYATIPRPLRRGLTLFQGYDPMSLQVSVRFIKFDSTGSWITDTGVVGGVGAGATIENEIAILEWMAGESINVGPSPFVYLSTFDGSGNSVPLIPFEYQTTSPNQPAAFGGGNPAPWIITGLSWDASPIRNTDGYRIRQDATVTVQYYQAPGGQPTSSKGRGKARSKSITVTSKANDDTPLKIARHQKTHDAQTLAEAIKNAPQNKDLQLRSIHSKIKHGKKVTVPSGN